ncbi:MAG: DUF3365 domain-containing protein [Gammaproteobacteria bacterium]|nr:DUF3365 domain-containing protein [Gammaproteobacteria bacterium]
MRIILSILIFLLSSQAAISDEFDTFSRQGQQAIKEFATALKASLTTAMQSGGSVEAITVCNSVAPTLSSELSKKYGMRIARTSLKVRNPDNAPDEWELGVLNHFEQRKKNGEYLNKLTFKTIINNEQGLQMRMMKAIATDKICLICHGTSISEPTQAVLDKYYPNDQATGYKLGDIRGAFTVQKILNNK